MVHKGNILKSNQLGSQKRMRQSTIRKLTYLDQISSSLLFSALHLESYASWGVQSETRI